VAVTIGTRTSEFTYDGQSRRVRIVEKDGGATISDIRFIWCELTLCEARDTGGAVTKRYLSNGVQESGLAYFYARDHRLVSAKPRAAGPSAAATGHAGHTRYTMAGSDVPKIGLSQ